MFETRRGFWLLVLALLLGWGLYELSPILSPFLVGMLLAYLGDPLADRLERWGLSRGIAVTLVFGLFALLLVILLLVLLPMLGRQLVRLYQLIPLILDWLQTTALPWIQIRLGLSEDFWRLDHLQQTLRGHLGQTTDLVGLILSQATASGLALVAWVGNLLLIPVVSFYLLRDWDVLMQRIRGLLPRRQEPVVTRLARECHEVLGAFLRGQLLVMLGLATIYAVGLMLVGLELGLLIGVIAGLASIVPYMGFAVGLAAAVVAALFQFGGFDPYALLGVAAVFAVGQLLEGMLLTPWLVGDRIGLHPVAVIFAVLAGGQLFGFTGILLALPIAAVIMVLLRHVHELYRLSALYGAPEVDDDRPDPT